MDTVKEKALQSTLPNVPLSKYSDPKPLKDKLKTASTDDVLQYYDQFQSNFKPEEVQELRKLLKKKADTSNERGKLSDDEKYRILKAFPDFELKPVMPKLPSMKTMPSKFDDDED